MPFVRPNDVTVHYDFSGPHDAPVVLLVNSLATNVHMWDEQMNALARTHRVLRYDMRGHGLTDVTPGDRATAASIEQLADDAVALLDALGATRVSLVGLSIGGMVAQRVAARHPARVDALVLCATGSRLGTNPIWDERLATVEREGVGVIVDSTMGRWFTEQTHASRPELVRGFANMVGRTPKEGYLACGRAVRDADLRADDALIRARTLIVAGAHDPTASPEVGAEMRDAIAGAQLEVMPAAHMLCAEQPTAFNELLLRFLDA
jgi:3-oxoadipate enol-lactonase